jgi:hypothetical protein
MTRTLLVVGVIPTSFVVAPGRDLRTDLQIIDNSRMEETSTGSFNRAITLTNRP